MPETLELTCGLCGTKIISDGYFISGGIAYHFGGGCPVSPAPKPKPSKPLTEEDVRRIVREEIELDKVTEHER